MMPRRRSPSTCRGAQRPHHDQQRPRRPDQRCRSSICHVLDAGNHPGPRRHGQSQHDRLGGGHPHPGCGQFRNQPSRPQCRCRGQDRGDGGHGHRTPRHGPGRQWVQCPSPGQRDRRGDAPVRPGQVGGYRRRDHTGRRQGRPQLPGIQAAQGADVCAGRDGIRGAHRPDIAAFDHLQYKLNTTAGWTINNPTYKSAGTRIEIEVWNNSGGVASVTWGADFVFATAWAAPANGSRITSTFVSDGTNWREVARA